MTDCEDGGSFRSDFSEWVKFRDRRLDGHR